MYVTGRTLNDQVNRPLAEASAVAFVIPKGLDFNLVKSEGRGQYEDHNGYD
jgi:hypothetical protein